MDLNLYVKVEAIRSIEKKTKESQSLFIQEKPYILRLSKTLSKHLKLILKILSKNFEKTSFGKNIHFSNRIDLKGGGTYSTEA